MSHLCHLLALTLAVSAPCLAADSPPRPNVVLIMTDDR
jgi:hypothetical protein